MFNNSKKKTEENIYEYTIDLNKYCKSLSLESIDPKIYLKRNINFDAISLEMLDEQFYSLEGLKDIVLKIGEFAKKVFDFILNLLINLKNKVKNFFNITLRNKINAILNKLSKISRSTESNVEDYNLGNLDVDLVSNRHLVLFKFIKDNTENMIKFLTMDKETFLEIIFSSFPSGENHNLKHNDVIIECKNIIKELSTLNDKIANYSDLPSQREKQLSDYEIKGNIELESDHSNAYFRLKKYFNSDFPKHEINYKEKFANKLKEFYNMNFQVERIIPNVTNIESYLHIDNHDLNTSIIFKKVCNNTFIVHNAIEQDKHINFLINIFREFAKIRNSRVELKEFSSQRAFNRFMKFLTAVSEYSNEIFKLKMNIIQMITACLSSYITHISKTHEYAKEKPINIDEKRI